MVTLFSANKQDENKKAERNIYYFFVKKLDKFNYKGERKVRPENSNFISLKLWGGI